MVFLEFLGDYAETIFCLVFCCHFQPSPLFLRQCRACYVYYYKLCGSKLGPATSMGKGPKAKANLHTESPKTLFLLLLLSQANVLVAR